MTHNTSGNVPMSDIAFIADVMLGRLAKWLRVLGFDTEYSAAMKANQLIMRAHQENRQILTRATRLRARDDIRKRLCFIRANAPLDQLREVAADPRHA